MSTPLSGSQSPKPTRPQVDRPARRPPAAPHPPLGTAPLRGRDERPDARLVHVQWVDSVEVEVGSVRCHPSRKNAGDVIPIELMPPRNAAETALDATSKDVGVTARGHDDESSRPVALATARVPSTSTSLATPSRTTDRPFRSCAVARFQRIDHPTLRYSSRDILSSASWRSSKPLMAAIAQSQPSTGASSTVAAHSASVDFPVPGGPVTTSRVGRLATET